MPLLCPFCGAPETERLVLEGHVTVVFQCLFAPTFPEGAPESEMADRLKNDYPAGATYFRAVCDRLHLYVTKGNAARELGASPAD